MVSAKVKPKRSGFLFRATPCRLSVKPRANGASRAMESVRGDELINWRKDSVGGKGEEGGSGSFSPASEGKGIIAARGRSARLK